MKSTSFLLGTKVPNPVELCSKPWSGRKTIIHHSLRIFYGCSVQLPGFSLTVTVPLSKYTFFLLGIIRLLTKTGSTAIDSQSLRS